MPLLKEIETLRRELNNHQALRTENLEETLHDPRILALAERLDLLILSEIKKATEASGDPTVAR